MSGFNLTDLGNAKRFVIQHCLDVKYVHGWGWLYWDGARWVRDTTGAIPRKAKETVMSIYREVPLCDDADTRKALSQHATKSESEVAIRHIIELAKTEFEVVSKPGFFDLDPYLLNSVAEYECCIEPPCKMCLTDNMWEGGACFCRKVIEKGSFRGVNYVCGECAIGLAERRGVFEMARRTSRYALVTMGGLILVPIGWYYLKNRGKRKEGKGDDQA